MQFPKLKPSTRRRVQIDAFRGYEHTPVVRVGAFYDMKNISGERAPLLRVRRRRAEVSELDDCPADAVLAVAGRGAPVLLDMDGTLWAGGNSLARLLPGESSLYAWDDANHNVPILRQQAVLDALTKPGSYEFQYDSQGELWCNVSGPEQLPGDSFDVFPRVGGQRLSILYDYELEDYQLRQMVFLGGWVCVFPDGVYANTVKLLPLPEPRLRSWSESQGLWVDRKSVV